MKNTNLILLIGLIFLPTTIVVGQKGGNGPVGIFQSQAEYSQFMGNAKTMAYGENGTPELQAMIPMLNDLALNQPIGSTANQYGAEASTLGLLSNPNVRAELEMVDDQYEELKNANSSIQRRSAERLRSLDFSDSSNLLDQIRSIREEADRELNAVLLPHQVERLKQVRMQSQLRRRSLVQILTNDPVKSELEITDRQSEELRQAEKEIEDDLAKEIAKLREQARDRLLSKLNPSQKAEAKEMIGDTFEFAAPSNARKNKAKTSRFKNGKARGKLKKD